MSDLRYLACSDIQFPLQDDRAVNLWLSVLKGFKPHMIDLVGDLDDSDSTSRWAVGPEKMISVDEAGAKATREFLETIRGIAPKGDIHLFDGNHGWTRHDKFIKDNAPQFAGQITPDTLYKHSDYGVEFHYYGDLPYNRFNDMYVHHGVAVSKHSGESVKADIDSWGVSLIRGHSHRLGDYFKTYEITGQRLEGYEIGHMMKVEKADYSNQRNWQQGFLYGYISGGQHFLELVPIKETDEGYTCFVGGKKYTA
jgi:hypothetical protein